MVSVECDPRRMSSAATLKSATPPGRRTRCISASACASLCVVEAIEHVERRRDVRRARPPAAASSPIRGRSDVDARERRPARLVTVRRRRQDRSRAASRGCDPCPAPQSTTSCGRRPSSAASIIWRATRRRPLNQKCASSARAVASSIASIYSDLDARQSQAETATVGAAVALGGHVGQVGLDGDQRPSSRSARRPGPGCSRRSRPTARSAPVRGHRRAR